MSDRALLQEGSAEPPMNITTETGAATAGGHPPSLSQTAPPCLRAVWLQPTLPTPVVQTAAVALNCLLPHASLLQPPLRPDEWPQVLESMGLQHAIYGWGMTSSFPVPFIRPISSQPFPIDQRHGPLPSVASHQTLLRQPHGQGQPNPSQDGRVLFMHSHPTSAPVLQRQQHTVAQDSRTVTTCPPSIVLKVLEPPTLQKDAPATGICQFPSNSRKRKITAITTTVVAAPPDTKQVTVQPDEKNPGKADHGLFAPFSDEVQVPQHLLDQEFPDMETLMASFEPLLESTDPEQTREDNCFKKICSEVFLSTKAKETDNDHPRGGQPQGQNMPTLEIPNRTKTCMCPLALSLSLVSTQALGERLMDIIDLCASEDEGSGTAGGQKPPSSGPLPSRQVIEIKIPSVSKGAVREEWKKGSLDPTKDGQRDLPPEKLPPKKLWRKRAMADQASPIKAKIKIDHPETDILGPNEKKTEIKGSGPRSKVLPKEKKNAQSKKAQTTKATNSKSKMETKAQPESSKAMPKSNLALRMMESVQVFHPLGKNSVSTLPAQKDHSVPSSSTVPAKPCSTSARPLPKALPKPVPQTQLKSCPLTKAMPPSSLAKPQSSSLAKPSAIPFWGQQPLMRPKPQPMSLKETLPSTAGRKPGLQPRQGIPMQDRPRPSHSQPKRPVSTTFPFCPRTVPRDHGFVLKYSPPAPILPFEIAFRNWKRPLADLGVSKPITHQQRPIREMMKQRAQRERQEAAQWTSLGRVQFFVERQKEKDISDMFGYP